MIYEQNGNFSKRDRNYKKKTNGNSGTEQYKEELRRQAYLRFEQAEE